MCKHTILCTCSILWSAFVEFESVVVDSYLLTNLDADIVHLTSVFRPGNEVLSQTRKFVRRNYYCNQLYSISLVP